jgi:polygalacturonase
MLLSQIPLPSIPDGVFDITAYGAVGDGRTVNTTAIHNAISAAHAAGGGTVLVPAGTFLSGPITLANNINLEVDAGATLRMLPYGTYPSSSTPFITASNLHDVEVSGAGVIDGQGAGWYSHSSRPNLFHFANSSIVAVQDVTLLNSPKMHLTFSATNNVTIDTVTISAPANSPNTDGIDPAGSNYLIENCTIADGDDNIAVKPQSVFCSNITVANCFFGSGHGLSIGGETNDGLDGMTVTNCTFQGTTNGLRLKAGRGFGGLVQNVTFDQITMTGVQHPLWITSYYLNGTATDPSDPSRDHGQPVTSTTPFWQNITFSNITATGASNVGTLYGLPEAPLSNITLTNVNISASSRMKVYHAQNVQFVHSTLTPSGPLTYDATVATSAVAFLDAGFELPFVGIGFPGAYEYDPSGSPWTFTDSAGVAGNWTDLTLGNPDAPQGTQVAFLENLGGVSQTLVFPAGAWTVSCLAGQWAGNSSSQSIQVLVDGVPVGTFTPADVNYAPFTSDSFTVTAGAHTVSFVGIDPDGQENIAFLDEASVDPAGTAPGPGNRPTGGAGAGHSPGGDAWLGVALPSPAGSTSAGLPAPGFREHPGTLPYEGDAAALQVLLARRSGLLGDAVLARSSHARVVGGGW